MRLRTSDQNQDAYFEAKLPFYPPYEVKYGLQNEVLTNAVFCLYCYLFGQDVGKQGRGETFVMKGFKLWNQKEKSNSHVGEVNSAYNQVVKKSEDLVNEK